MKMILRQQRRHTPVMPPAQNRRMTTITWRPPANPQAKRGQLPDTAFAFPKERKEPLTDAAHVRSALARFHQVDGVNARERVQAEANIWAAAKYYGVHLAHERPVTSA
jgi:hypothetical protein